MIIAWGEEMSEIQKNSYSLAKKQFNLELINLIQNGIAVSYNLERLYENNIGFIYDTMMDCNISTNSDLAKDLAQVAFFAIYDSAIKFDKSKGLSYLNYLNLWLIHYFYRELLRMKYSFKITNTACFKLDFTQYFSQVESAKIEVKPELLNSKGEVIGEIANIGWNGFEQIAEIYKSNPVKNIEVCLQPTQDFSDGDYIKFNLTDTENNVVFDSVTYDVSLLKKATDGPTIKRIKDTTKIKSINGAKYSFTLNSVCSSQEYLNIDSYSDLVKMMDLDYTVKLLKDKVNGRVVTRFNTFSGVQMNSEVKLAVNTCNNSQYNYTYYQDATRTNYSDVDDYVPYVTSNFPYIKKGETANNVTNRVLSYDLDSEDPMYVRVIPEFTNERKARSDEEMLKFNGRYVVYQVELKARNLPKYYKGEW